MLLFPFQSLALKGNDMLSVSSLEASPLSTKEIKERSNRKKRKKSLGIEDNEEEQQFPKSQSTDNQRKLVIYCLSLRSLQIFLILMLK